MVLEVAIPGHEGTFSERILLTLIGVCAKLVFVSLSQVMHVGL